MKFEAEESIAHYLGRIAASGCSVAGSSTSNSGTSEPSAARPESVARDGRAYRLMPSSLRDPVPSVPTTTSAQLELCDGTPVATNPFFFFFYQTLYSFRFRFESRVYIYSGIIYGAIERSLANNLYILMRMKRSGASKPVKKLSQAGCRSKQKLRLLSISLARNHQTNRDLEKHGIRLYDYATAK